MGVRPDVALEVLPCGCKLGTGFEDGQPVFVFEPHAPDCEYYLYVLDQSKRQGKPMELRSVD